MQETAALWTTAELVALAEQVATALKSKAIPRRDRGRVRALLAQAFDAIEREVSPEPALCRALDDVAHPRQITIPRPITIGVRLLAPAVDDAWVMRLVAPIEQAERHIARIERFLSVSGFELQLPEVRDLIIDGAEPDFELTRG